MKYTHNNNELTIKNLNQIVVLKGWVSKRRNLGGLIFIDLRDRFGITQIMVKPENQNYEIAKEIKNEYVISVTGTVIERESKNLNIETGEIEVLADSIQILSKAENPPIQISENDDASEEVRLKYRYLDLRKPSQQKYLIKRHEISQAVRKYLNKKGFYELETPMLGKSTPEGARDFLVPSRLYKKEFYALPQSPQMYKQLFMVAGFEKYYQMARCFRDEDLRADRQLEFTQIDIEMSFIEQKDIIKLIEGLLKDVYKDVLNQNIKTPFLKMSYQSAMERFGSDKPDIRFDLELQDYKAILKPLDIPILEKCKYIKGIVINENISRKDIDRYSNIVRQNHGKLLAYLKNVNGEISGSLAKYLNDDAIKALSLTDNSTLFIVPGDFDSVSQSLGALRTTLGEEYQLYDKNENAFLWVVDFPLLEYSEEDKRFYAKHHPFTSPKSFEMLKKNPKKCLANAYDVILNGYELGGGSIRIHDTKMQELMFNTLSFSNEDIKNKFGFFVDALKYGTPPHGGIALGLDRLVMLMTNTTNIRDVVAFPKIQSAKDLMTAAPSEVDEIQLNEIGLKYE